MRSTRQLIIGGGWSETEPGTFDEYTPALFGLTETGKEWWRRRVAPGNPVADLATGSAGTAAAVHHGADGPAGRVLAVGATGTTRCRERYEGLASTALTWVPGSSLELATGGETGGGFGISRLTIGGALRWTTEYETATAGSFLPHSAIEPHEDDVGWVGMKRPPALGLSTHGRLVIAGRTSGYGLQGGGTNGYFAGVDTAAVVGTSGEFLFPALGAASLGGWYLYRRLTRGDADEADDGTQQSKPNSRPDGEEGVAIDEYGEFVNDREDDS